MTQIAPFFQNDRLARQYVAKLAKDFNFLVLDQARVLYPKRGLTIPVHCSSALQYVAHNGPVTLADTSRALEQPHQLIAHRIKELIQQGYVERQADPKDGRRKLLSLSSTGRRQADLLHDFVEEADVVFTRLFEEIGVDLSVALGKAITGLKRHPLEGRFGDGSAQTGTGS